MMNRGYFKPSLKQRVKNLVVHDHIMDFLVTMRKVDYYTNIGGGYQTVNQQDEIQKAVPETGALNRTAGLRIWTRNSTLRDNRCRVIKPGWELLCPAHFDLYH